MINKRAQIWVETVVYTLIGLSIIGIVIAIATPRINQMKDNVIIEQTITAMNTLHEKILGVQTAVGNSRKVDFRIKKGILSIDGINNKLVFTIEGTNLKYSQPGTDIPQGDMTIRTDEVNEDYNVNLILNYQGKYDIKVNGIDDKKDLTMAPSPYQLLIKNNGNGVLDVSLI